MRRGTLAVTALAAALVGNVVDLDACGDKFLRVGRSPRLQNYASIHPSSILVYQPARPDAKGVKAFEKMLSRAGHKPVFVTHGTDISRAVTDGSYALVIVNYSDAATVGVQLRSLPAGPDVLPILNGPSKSVLAQARAEYHCLLTPHNMTERDALEEIDHAIEVRLKGIVPPDAGR
jgi:hypothetical protein